MNVIYTGINASLTYNISGESRNCKVGIDEYGVGKLYTSFVYKLRPGMYKCGNASSMTKVVLDTDLHNPNCFYP